LIAFIVLFVFSCETKKRNILKKIDETHPHFPQHKTKQTQQQNITKFLNEKKNI